MWPSITNLSENAKYNHNLGRRDIVQVQQPSFIAKNDEISFTGDKLIANLVKLIRFYCASCQVLSKKIKF